MSDESPSAASADRVVLKGIPRVHFIEGEGCAEEIPIASCLRACLHFMRDERIGCLHIRGLRPGNRVPCAYTYLVGTSGMGSLLSWKPGWTLDGSAPENMSDDPDAPYRHAMESLGYTYKIVRKPEGQDNETLFRNHIVASIRDRGRPVVALGVVGPPEACIVSGYDEGGDVLIGWSFFQNSPDFSAGIEFEPSGQYRKRDWFKDTEALLLIGEQKADFSLGNAYLEGLRWSLQVIRTPVTRGDRRNGLAAYTAWADALLSDEAFPAGDETTLRAHFQAHHMAVCNVAIARWFANLFFLQAVVNVHYSLVEDLLHAAACYAAEHDLMWKIWNLAGGIANSDAWRLVAEPTVRRQIVALILEALHKEMEAADHLERALSMPQAG